MTMFTRATTAPSRSSLRRLIVGRPLTAYFALAYALTWALVLPMTLSVNLGLGLLPYALPDAVGLALFVLASFIGPSVAAVIVTALSEGRAALGRLLRPIGRWRVAPQWYLVAMLANLAIWLAAYGIVLGPALFGALVGRWPLLLSTFLPGVAFGLLIPAIGEEPGWRGFALPRLQARYGPLRATLILGAMHGLWHLPTLGTIMLGPLRPAEVAPFLLTALGATFLYTWMWNSTGGSVLLAMLTHAASNAASQLLTALIEQGGLVLPEAGLAGWLIGDGWIHTIAYVATALLLVALTRGRLGAPSAPRAR
jgi:membrane protease YdiL (CAAX protease family)